MANKRRTQRHYSKTQTMWTRFPAALGAHQCTTGIGITIYPEWAVGSERNEPASIFLTANEAKGFAAWLAEQADDIDERRQKADARRAARLAKQRGDA